LLNAIDRGENIGGGGKNGRRRNSDSLESSGFCEPNETSETFEDEFEELEETDFCDGNFFVLFPKK
jgi:hypothetical protein